MERRPLAVMMVRSNAARECAQGDHPFAEGQQLPESRRNPDVLRARSARRGVKPLLARSNACDRAHIWMMRVKSSNLP